MARRITSGLLKHSLLLLAATQVANICNILFQAAMGRLLPPAEYGVLLTMLGLALIVITPLQAITAVAAHYTALLSAQGRIREVSAYVCFWCRRLSLPIVILLAAAFFGASPLRRFFHLSGTGPVRLTLTAIAISVLVPLLVGVLQGLQRFVWMTLTAYAWAVIRLVASVALALAWKRTAMAGLWGQAIGVLASVGCGIVALGALSETRGRPLSALPGVHRYFAGSLLVLSGFSLLSYLDVPLMKHYFADPHVAGIYSRASVIGRAAFFLPMPIAQAMFPKVASSGFMDTHDRRNLIKAILFTVLLSGTVAVVLSLFPGIPHGVLFGDMRPNPEVVRLTRAAIWAMAPLSLLFLLLNFEMAQHRFLAALTVLPAAAAFVAGTAIWHASPIQVLAVLGAVAGSTVVILCLAIPWTRPKFRPEPDGTNATGDPHKGSASE
ncbi:MAG TPA: hypothetical protein EYP62_06040 [Kiritimatiellae bacterium]|nr:hypothetical protein [Kiritimatiellia bacterium]